MWRGKVSNAINTIISTKFYKPNCYNDLLSHCGLLRVEKVYTAVKNVSVSELCALFPGTNIALLLSHP